MFKYNSPEAQKEIRLELGVLQDKVNEAIREEMKNSIEDEPDLSDMSEILEFALEEIERKFNLMEWVSDEIDDSYEYNSELGEIIWDDSKLGEYDESLYMHNFSLLTALSHLEMLSDENVNLSSPDETVYTSDRSNSPVFTPAKIAENCLNTMDSFSIDIMNAQELLDSELYKDEDYFSPKKRLAIKAIVEALEVATESLTSIAEGRANLSSNSKVNNESPDSNKGNQTSQKIAAIGFEKINKIVHL